MKLNIKLWTPELQDSVCIWYFVCSHEVGLRSLRFLVHLRIARVQHQIQSCKQGVMSLISSLTSLCLLASECSGWMCWSSVRWSAVPSLLNDNVCTLQMHLYLLCLLYFRIYSPRGGWPRHCAAIIAPSAWCDLWTSADGRWGTGQPRLGSWRLQLLICSFGFSTRNYRQTNNCQLVDISSL